MLALVNARVRARSHLRASKSAAASQHQPRMQHRRIGRACACSMPGFDRIAASPVLAVSTHRPPAPPTLLPAPSAARPLARPPASLARPTARPLTLPTRPKAHLLVCSFAQSASVRNRDCGGGASLGRPKQSATRYCEAICDTVLRSNLRHGTAKQSATRYCASGSHESQSESGPTAAAGLQLVRYSHGRLRGSEPVRWQMAASRVLARDASWHWHARC